MNPFLVFLRKSRYKKSAYSEEYSCTYFRNTITRLG